METEKIKRYEIPGCPGYFLTGDFRILGKNGRSALRASYHTVYKHNRYYNLLSELKPLRCALPRIVWAVRHRVKLYDIPSGILISFQDDRPNFDRFTIRSRETLITEVRLKKIHDAEDPDYYGRCREFATLVIERDTAGVYAFMERYKDPIIRGLSRRMPRPDAERLYTDVVNDFVLGVFAGRYQAPDPVSYIRKYANAVCTHHLTDRQRAELREACLRSEEEN